MATKKKNTPSKQDVRETFTYIDESVHNGLLMQYAGRLIPKKYLDGVPVQAVNAILEYYQHLYCDELDAYRFLNCKGVRHPEAKLVYLYHTGKYPSMAMIHKNGDYLDTRIENLQIGEATKRSTIGIINTKRKLAGLEPLQETKTKRYSGVVGICFVTTQANAYTWKVEYIRNEAREVPVDEKGNEITWRSKGWHKRLTKIVNKREKTLLGFYQSLDEAKRELSLHKNEVRHPICRWRTDKKIQTLCLLLQNEGALERYIQQLYQHALVNDSDLFAIMDALHCADVPLPVRDDDVEREEDGF